MGFDQWLESLGWTRLDENRIMGNGRISTVQDENLDTAYTQLGKPAIFGTGGEISGENTDYGNRRFLGPDGQFYLQVGGDPATDPRLASYATYDPTYGWIAPQNIMAQLNPEPSGFGDKWGAFPMIAAIAGGALASGMGAAGGMTVPGAGTALADATAGIGSTGALTGGAAAWPAIPAVSQLMGAAGTLAGELPAGTTYLGMAAPAAGAVADAMSGSGGADWYDAYNRLMDIPASDVSGINFGDGYNLTTSGYDWEDALKRIMDIPASDVGGTFDPREWGMPSGLSNAWSAIKSFLPSSGGGPNTKDGLGYNFGTLAAIGPGLAAINYARNQDPFNTSQLQSLYSQIPTSFNYDTSGLKGINVPTSYDFGAGALNDLAGQVPTSFNFDTSKLNAAYDDFDPMSVTKQYDLNTGQGRGALADSLSARGVSGSSFGNYDMANYGVQRDAGRQSLVNDAILKRAGIAESLLNNDRATAQLGLQGTQLRGGLLNNASGIRQNEASLGLQGLNLQRGIQNDLLNAQATQDKLRLTGLGMQGDLANQMLGAQVKDRQMRNDLYGRALLALSGGLSPSKLSLW